jgi:hypothetical protein
MIRIIVAAVIIVSLGRHTFAQSAIPNMGFENWEMVNSVEQPVGWTTSPFGAGRTDSAYFGSNAVQIWNWYYYSKGRLCLGNTEYTEHDLLRSGIPFRGKMTELFGSYKYWHGANGGKNDSAVVMVMLKRHNPITGNTDTVGFGTKRLSPGGEYKDFSVIIQKFSEERPDSLAILFMSSDSGFCEVSGTGNCLYLTIDDLGWVGLVDGVAVRTRFRTAAYPNPFTTSFSLGNAATNATNVRVFDLRGLECTQRSFNAGEEMLITFTDRKLGLYFFEVYEPGEPIRIGKVIAR